jgi:tetratricopeptide (TPR) repeat protein
MRYFLLIFSLLAISAFAQTPSAASAEQKFVAGNYDGALVEYLRLLETDSKNEIYNLRVAICYLETNIEKCKALPFLEFLGNQPKQTTGVQYYLGVAYSYCNKFDNAIEAYKKALAQTLPAGIEKAKIERRIEWASNAKELMRAPIPVAFENLGPNINSPFADYSPFISSDENFLMYNSNRPDESIMKSDGKYAANVYLSKVKEGKWQRAENIGEQVNTPEGDEEIVGVCADGNTLIYSFENKTVKGDILVGPKMEDEILVPFKVSPNINSDSVESAAAISPDGRVLYFASNRPGGLGGFDIYRSMILPNGEWGEAFNLGPNINTPFDENFPNISMNGRELYFSSMGHNSMGGYDIFKSELAEDGINFGKASNMGYPVNTAMDDRNLCMSQNGKYAYLSTIRKGKDSMGDLDIYRVVFKSVDGELTVIKGVVSSSIPATKITACNIEVIEAKSNETYGTYKVNAANGKYVIVLPPGQYYLQIDGTGFKSLSENVNVLDKGSFVPLIEKNFTIQPK